MLWMLSLLTFAAPFCLLLALHVGTRLQALTQSILDACLGTLTIDINAVGASTYYGTTDAYRRSVAAALLYKVPLAFSVSASETTRAV